MGLFLEDQLQPAETFISYWTQPGSGLAHNLKEKKTQQHMLINELSRCWQVDFISCYVFIGQIKDKSRQESDLNVFELFFRLQFITTLCLLYVSMAPRFIWVMHL